MLQRQVEVRHTGGTHRVDQAVGEFGGIQVQQSDPVDPGSHRLHQGDDGLVAHALIPPVGGEVLGYQDNLPGVEGVDLSQHLTHGAAALGSPERRDGAEPAGPITSLGHLHVGPRALRGRAGKVQKVERRSRGRLVPQDYRHPEPNYPIHLGERLGQFVAVALGHTAGHHQPGTVPAFVDQGQHRVDGLPSGLVNEGASIDDDEVGLIDTLDRSHPVSSQCSGQLVGVDLILGTSQRNQVVGAGHGRQVRSRPMWPAGPRPPRTRPGERLPRSG